MRLYIVLSSLILIIISTTFLPAKGKSSPSLANSETIQAHEWIDSVMNSLTLREKIAQLFMVAAYSNRDQKHIEEIAEMVRDEKIGGLCFFQGGPVRQSQLTNYYQSIADVPLLISMDAEWGLGMRLDSTISYPRQMLLGAMDDNSLIYHMGADIARQLRRIGVHINFAPVIDINNNPQNPVINTRAFGEDKEMVTQKGLAYMLGLQDNGVLACAKHFPGHGDTDIDSHYDLPMLDHTKDRLDSLELHPFRKLVQNGVASVMVAHMEIPALESKSKVASSISSNIVSSLLIEELEFNGLVITDALNMKGVSDHYKPVDLNYKALKAGNDIILFPSQVSASISKIEREVKRGRFPIEEIERRCRKIIEAKYKVGLSKYQPIDLDNLVKDLNSPSSEMLIRQITEQAITVLSNANDLMPLQRLDTLDIAYIEIGDGRGNDFREQMELYTSIETYPISAQADEDELDELLISLCPYNLIIIGHHAMSSLPNRDFGITPHLAGFIDEISVNKKIIINLFGTPYALSKFKNLQRADGLVLSYDNSTLSQSITSQLIFGGVEVSGRLPVTATTAYTLGSGFDAGKKIRLKYSMPEELNLSSTIISKIDSIALDAIANQATPGMQILAAKDGIVFYNKTFGKHTYIDIDLQVDHQSIYDIASLTKIAGLLPVLMHLYSEEEFSLNDNLGEFLSLPDTSAYNELVLYDILLHQAGLRPWIPFYNKTLTSLWPLLPVINSLSSNDFPYQLGRNRFMSKHSIPSRSFYRNSFSYEFPHEVARGMYAAEWIKDSIQTWILRSPIEENGSYKYSDLGFILLHEAAESILKTSSCDFLRNNFYRTLGMTNTVFNPLEHFEQERIVPTENDVFFRKQLLWGHVHDPAAAMMGGISGHAGLFSTANDMAKIMQMYINKGEYGGIRYLPSSTIDYFTSCINCVGGVRRGLGFDKPETDPEKPNPVCQEATSLSFGHSGFTGVMVWADPAYDLIYVFISNRIHPDVENRKLVARDVRTKIQKLIYQAIIASEEHL